HVDDGLYLVGRLLVGERLLDLALPRRVRGEGVALAGYAAPVEDDELLGDLPYGGAHTGLGALPVGSAQPVERRRLAAGVVTDGVDLVRRHVELVAALV